ncbi:MAG: hypothetical protein KC609_17435 [Myxococcales bacterium]|nr:hypothetical protein [Myxococcales bacterium]
MKRETHRFLVCCLSVALFAGCSKEPPTQAPYYLPGGRKVTKGSLTPNPHVHSQTNNLSPGPVDMGSIPLKAIGLGSKKTLDAELRGLSDAKAKKQYEEAFRLTFTSDRKKRNYRRARVLYEMVIKVAPKFAPAYRGIGYTVFSTTLNFAASNEWYKKAIAIDPTHGESHYAIAFIYGAEMMGAQRKNDLTEARRKFDLGKKHLEIAIKQGVPDERGLMQRFFTKRP